MEKRLRAACFYQEKEDKTSVTSVDSGPHGDSGETELLITQ